MGIFPPTLVLTCLFSALTAIPELLYPEAEVFELTQPSGSRRPAGCRLGIPTLESL